MSIMSAGRRAAANALAMIAHGLSGRKAEVAHVDGEDTPAVSMSADSETVKAHPLDEKVPAARPKKTRTHFWSKENLQARRAYYAGYKGGKHRRGVPKHIMHDYMTAAQAKRERKNAKRAAEFGYA